MAVDLADYVNVLRREITPPGTTAFSNVTDEELIGYLTDAFWEAHLDGFLHPYVASNFGIVTPVQPGGNDLPREQIALISLYAGIKILRNKLLGTTTRFEAKAGPVEFRTENSAAMLTEMLRQLAAVKSRIVGLNQNFGSVAVIDAFSVRDQSDNSYAGYLADIFNDFIQPGMN